MSLSVAASRENAAPFLQQQQERTMLWLTIEGATNAIEVQFWLSSFGLPQAQVDAFASRWETRLKQIF